ncbi:MAG TPA: sulfurtransferase TusA family protein [Alphaproteobacteria bacterium]
MKNSTLITKNGNTEPVLLDITAQVCPLTFVHTRLRLERLEPGEVLEIRLAGAEPLRNIPRTLADEGHEVLSLEPEPGSPGIHRLRVRKAG